jgi:phenylacetate-CoA ligase
MRLQLRLFYEGLLESQWWSADKLQALQRRHLTSLLNHARATTPFYRFRLGAAFGPNDAIEWARWNDLPIVTRADLSANFNTMLSRVPVRAHGPFGDQSSSGSTGDPVTVRTTGWMADMVAACNWRAHGWHRIDWSRTLLNRVYIDAPGRVSGDRTGPWGPPWDNRASQGSAVFLSKSTSLTGLFEAIADHQHGYVAVGASWPLELSLLNDALASPYRLRGFLVRGGGINSHDRETVHSSFGATTVELYSSKEAGPIAHPCPLDPSAFHVNDETVLVEVVDEDGRACQPGVAGRVLVTPFASTALPLIRYDQGDVAVAGQQCPCGRGLSVIRRIVGRMYDAFRHPDGRVVFGGVPLGELRGIIGAKRWQIAQVGPNRYTVRVQIGIECTSEARAEFLLRAKKVLFGDAEITIEYGCNLLSHKSGKFKEYVNEWNARH